MYVVTEFFDCEKQLRSHLFEDFDSAIRKHDQIIKERERGSWKLEATFKSDKPMVTNDDAENVIVDTMGFSYGEVVIVRIFKFD